METDQCVAVEPPTHTHISLNHVIRSGGDGMNKLDLDHILEEEDIFQARNRDVAKRVHPKSDWPPLVPRLPESEGGRYLAFNYN